MNTRAKITRSLTPRNPDIKTYLPESVTFSTLSEIYSLEKIALALNAGIQDCELRSFFPKHVLHTLIVFYHDLLEFEYGSKTLSLMKITFERTWADPKPIKTYQLLFAIESAIKEMTQFRTELHPITQKNVDVLKSVRNHLIKAQLGEQSWELCESLIA